MTEPWPERSPPSGARSRAVTAPADISTAAVASFDACTDVR
ncbi:MAG: hypothetical protein QOH95_2540, partial [Gaiellaceae bacterium]|nr:hypothetical protein [Gaiellaceae bacterium]